MTQTSDKNSKKTVSSKKTKMDSWMEMFSEKDSQKILESFKRRRINTKSALAICFNFKLFKKTSLIFLIIILFLVNSFWMSPESLGATYTFSQTGWSGGLSGSSYPVHPDNTNDWNKYASKDDSVSVINDGTDVSLSATSSSIAKDTDTDFSSGTFENTEIVGSGSDAVISLSREGQVAELDVSGEGNHFCSLGEDGYVYCWGQNTYGQLGNNSLDNSSVPVRVVKGNSIEADNDGTFLANIKKISVGSSYACAVSNSGYVYCWGVNTSYQLADGTSVSKGYPARVVKGSSVAGDNDGTYLSNINFIATGGSGSSCAVSSAGNVYCWGANTAGQLGDNSTSLRSTPVRVIKGDSFAIDNDGTYLSNIEKVNMGYGYNGNACAVSNSGNIYCWGYGAGGILGNGTTDNKFYPVRVVKGEAQETDNDGTFLDNIKDVSNNIRHTCAVSNSGYVYCWGSNTYGQLGNNSTTQSYVPIQVLKGVAGESDNDGTYLSNIDKIFLGSDNTFALANSGYVYSWGENSYYSLGAGISGVQKVPVRVVKGEAQETDNDGTYLKNVKSVTEGGYQHCLIANSGYIYCFGHNNYGQLGDNSTTSRATPVLVHGLLDSGYLFLKTNYNSSGNYINTIDFGQFSDFSTLNFSATIADGTVLSVDIRAGNSASPDGTWTDWLTGITNGGSLASFQNYRYLQYRLNFSTENVSVSSSLNNITFGYSYYPASAELISSAYDTSDNLNVMSKISWTENLASGTDAKFQIRTTSDNSGVPGTWSDWIGPDGTNTSYFTNPSGGESMPSQFSDESGDEWFQYKLIFSSDGSNAPLLSDVSVNYVVNAPPQIQNVTASQGTDGTVSISYEVRDIDTASGTFTEGYITPSFEYWNGSEWLNCATMVGGSLENKEVEEINFSTHTAVWNAKNDFSGQYLPNTVKIRVAVNDNEGANNTASAESGAFRLDTKNPTEFSFVIDHIQNLLSVTTPTDDSSYQMAVSNRSDFSGAVFEAFQSSYTYAGMTNDPATVYVRIKDAYGNYRDVSVSTPANPRNLTYYDVTDTANEEYRELIAWGAVSALESGTGFSAYHLYRSSDGENYALLTSVSDRLTNFYVDSSVELGKTYYYKLFVEDTAGNKSQFSEVVSDTIDGQGSSDSTPPSISEVTISDVQTTSAKVNWITDEVSDSSVGYSTDATYLPELGSGYMGTDHEIILTGLVPGTTYNIRVKSQDVSGNLAKVDKDAPGSNPIQNFTFETLPGPAISSVTIPQVANTQATIEWKTTTNSSTYVIYSAELDEDGNMVEPIEIGTPDLVGGNSPYKHSQTITELTENTRYYFSVKSVDASDNVALDNNGGEFYELLTTEDNDAPIISDVETSIVSDTEAAIHWVTNEQATSQIRYSTEEGGDYDETSEVAIMSRSHYVILTGLDPDTKYFYQVVSTDINGNETVSSEYDFTTLNDPEFNHDPLEEITNIEESVITDQKAVVKFETDQESTCSIEYGTQSGNYSEVPISESIYNLSHAVHLTGLIFSTTYYYRISCEDNLETVVSSEEKSFSTLEEQIDSSELDQTAPTISGVSTNSATGESITVSWKTDEIANSLVRYGATDEFGSMAGDDLVNMDQESYVEDHEVIINNLTPDTKYYYAAVSVDVAGNITESSQGTFTTKAASSLSSIKIESRSLNEVSITWKTSEKTSSVVEYGLTEEYGDKKESSNMSQDHSMGLTGLKSNTTYHFRVKGKDADNNWYSSGDYTLEPKSPPKISNLKISDITEHGATVAFNTDVPTDALITYTASDAEKSGFQGKPELSSKHEIELKNLESGTTFSLTVKVRDEDGNESESEASSFTTGKDENPPEIDQIKTDSALAQNDKVQSIITWNTNEPASTSIIYKEGKNGEEKEIKIDDNLSNYHIAVVTAFKSGTVYYFKTKSVDQSGNEATSEDYALLTPKKKENIVQIIVSNFEDIFGWAKF